LGLVSQPCNQAHEGPEHEIAELTEQMQVQGPTSNLLIQRAVEYNILGKYTEASKDLERALELDPNSINARRELSQAYFSLGKTNEALATVSRALRSIGEPADQAACLMIRAGMFRARKEFAKALADANEAIAKYPLNVEWYLVRSQLQALLKLKQERIQGLEDGIRETGSGLLSAERVDALIEAGRHADALAMIDRELQHGRWRSSWLIRRAKVRLAMDQRSEAQADLNAALQELNQRLTAKAPDPLLLADRGLVYDLLNKREQARADYRTARDKGLADEWILERIRALRNAAQEEE
jgi:tetratricopeptide (TPR) repeat protein